jgi:hypothetical protein
MGSDIFRATPSSALFARLPTTGTGGLHARASGSAVRPSRSARAHAGTAPIPKLTSPPDHSIGAGRDLGTGNCASGIHNACTRQRNHSGNGPHIRSQQLAILPNERPSERHAIALIVEAALMYASLA